jgi:capsular polysaccharide transport system ATP-binding protein
MIELSHVSKRYPVHGGDRLILDDINLRIERGEKIGILGRNGSGKSTLIRLISGAERPTSGTITRTMSVSWPLAFSGGFQGSLTGLDNLRFICRIYNTSIEDKIDFVQDFSELGRYLREPVKTYSSGMRARLAFALSMVIEFDCFLIDEVVVVGDSRFQAKCHEELFIRRKCRSLIIVSHSPTYITKYCSVACVMVDGRLMYFDDVGEAVRYHHQESGLN